MIGPTKIYFIIFGLLTIVGGVMGYLKAGSMASIIAGTISGVLILIAAFLLSGNPTAGLALGGIVSLLLIGYFLPTFLRAGKMMPHGMMSILSIVGAVLAILAWMRR